MHANALLLQRLFGALDRHDHATMARCYQPAASFRDIAFDLRSRKQIHAMWHMVCDGDIRVSFEVVEAGDRTGRVRQVDTYTFGAAGAAADDRRSVRNVVDSHFHFDGGLIVRQHDQCDARAWACAAIGGVSGFLAGRIRLLRELKARQKLRAFVERHPEYR